MTGAYDDIIGLPRHVSPTRAKMSPADRAAQFSPFAALTGYEAAVEETARQTVDKVELAADEREALDKTLLELWERRRELPEVTATYFLQDSLKQGGAYVTVRGRVCKIRPYEQWLQVNTTVIPFGDILSIREEG